MLVLVVVVVFFAYVSTRNLTNVPYLYCFDRLDGAALGKCRIAQRIEECTIFFGQLTGYVVFLFCFWFWV